MFVIIKYNKYFNFFSIYVHSIGIFILFERVTGRHGLFPSWEGVRGGFLGREISVNISRITDLPTPKSPPKRGLSKLNL